MRTNPLTFKDFEGLLTQKRSQLKNPDDDIVFEDTLFDFSDFTPFDLKKCVFEKCTFIPICHLKARFFSEAKFSGSHFQNGIFLVDGIETLPLNIMESVLLYSPFFQYPNPIQPNTLIKCECDYAMEGYRKYQNDYPNNIYENSAAFAMYANTARIDKTKEIFFSTGATLQFIVNERQQNDAFTKKIIRYAFMVQHLKHTRNLSVKNLKNYIAEGFNDFSGLHIVPDTHETKIDLSLVYCDGKDFSNTFFCVMVKPFCMGNKKNLTGCNFDNAYCSHIVLNLCHKGDIIFTSEELIWAITNTIENHVCYLQDEHYLELCHLLKIATQAPPRYILKILAYIQTMEGVLHKVVYATCEEYHQLPVHYKEAVADFGKFFTNITDQLTIKEIFYSHIKDLLLEHMNDQFPDSHFTKKLIVMIQMLFSKNLCNTKNMINFLIYFVEQMGGSYESLRPLRVYVSLQFFCEFQYKNLTQQEVITRLKILFEYNKTEVEKSIQHAISDTEESLNNTQRFFTSPANSSSATSPVSCADTNDFSDTNPIVPADLETESRLTRH